MPDQPLQDAQWVVFSAKGFETKECARMFGNRLRYSVELAGLAALVGVDVGNGQPTSWANEEWHREQGLIEPHQRLLPNVHGLMIVPDDDHNRISIVEATAIVRSDPAQVLGAIDEVLANETFGSGERFAAIRLLNLALLSKEPLAAATLAIAAVESLGQDEQWSANQRAKILKISSDLKSKARKGDNETIEIAEALERNLHRIGLRQGVMRVLDRLGLKEMRREWDALYRIRSAIFHGTKDIPTAEIAEFAAKAQSLCTKIILASFRQEGLYVPATAERNFGKL